MSLHPRLLNEFAFLPLPFPILSYNLDHLLRTAQLNSQINQAREAAERAEELLSETYDLRLMEGNDTVAESCGEEAAEVSGIDSAFVVPKNEVVQHAEDMRLSQRRSAMREIVRKLHEQESDIKVM